MRARCPGCNIPLIPESMERLDRCPVCEHPLTPADLLEVEADRLDAEPIPAPEAPAPEVQREPVFRGGERGEKKANSGVLFVLVLLGWTWVLVIGAVMLKTVIDDVLPSLSLGWRLGDFWLLAHAIFDGVMSFFVFLLLGLPGYAVALILPRSNI